MLNVITGYLPETVAVGGIDVPIATGFRTSIQVQRVIDSPLDDADIQAAILMHYYGNLDAFDEDWLAASATGLLAAAMDFANAAEFAEATRADKGSSVRTFDWDTDQRRVVADFQREYGLDLADSGVKMHWWRFLALFEGLSDDSRTMTAIGYRAMDIPPGLPKEEQQRLRKLKAHYQLRPRTKAEALARDAAIWGD
jgi:hypothetical protein